jgi:transposase InsO family protein
LDNGTEFGGNAFIQFCANNGITIEWTIPYTPEQNAVSKRTNRTILERARTMIIATGNPDLKLFWPKIMRTAIYLTNRVASASGY